MTVPLSGPVGANRAGAGGGGAGIVGGFDTAPLLWQGARRSGDGALFRDVRPLSHLQRVSDSMIKPEWGHKRSCPKCATRFYDLEKVDPVTCIECGYAWNPEPALKSKQPMPFEQVKQGAAPAAEPDTPADVDLDVDVEDDDNVSPDNDVDLGGDDDLGVDAPGDGDEEV